MKAIELFAGAGGLSLGLERAGIDVVMHAEIDKHARAVLRYRWPDTELQGDVAAIDGTAYRGRIDLVAGGSPCQDLSVAGRRAGLAGGRSGLFHEQVRIWNESNATYCLWENVLGALSSNNGKDFAAVLSAFVGAAVPVPTDGWRSSGVAAGPAGVAAWRVLDLQHFGPPQRRRRVFVLAARTGGVDPAEVLALGESVCGHPSPREQSRQDAAAAAGAGAAERGGVTAFHPTQSPISGDVSPAPGTTTQSMGVMAFDWQKGNDKDNPRPSTMNVQTEATNTLSATRVPAVLAFNPVATVAGGGVTHALTRSQKGATEGGTGRGTPIVVMASGQANAEIREDGAPTLTQLHEAPIVAVGRARRLMPVETERLMDWDDGHTAIGIDERGREYRLADGPRYKLCGNGVGSVCAEWIARRLVALDAALAKSPSTERAA